MNLNYRSFHLNLLTHAYNNLLQTPPFDDVEVESDEEQLLKAFTQALEFGQQESEEFMDAGQQLLTRIVRSYPEHVPLLPRDLFWFFGGECLHFMPDDEIATFQQLDELRYEAEDKGESFNYEQTRASVMKLH